MRVCALPLLLRKKTWLSKAFDRIKMILRLVDLPWYDVVYAHIFFRLDLRDLCRLRCLSTEYRILVDNYLATWNTLDLSPYSSNIEPSCFQGLVRVCEGLRRVNLRDSYWLGSSHLVDLLGMHPELTHLDLTGCNGSDMRHNFIETTKCRNLTSVSLRGCAWVTADFLSTLLRYNRNLRELLLADCHRLCDEAVASTFGIRTALTDLSLERCTISDKSLSAISECCEEIESLDLRTCPKITNEGLMSLRSLRRLKRLWVSGCTSITERGLAPFRDRVEIDVLQKPICTPQIPYLQV